MLRSITPKRATTSLAASVDPTEACDSRAEGEPALDLELRTRTQLGYDTVVGTDR